VIEKVEAYQASSGNCYASKNEAVRDEIQLLLVGAVKPMPSESPVYHIACSILARVLIDDKQIRETIGRLLQEVI
jgi:hypothetical protein